MIKMVLKRIWKQRRSNRWLIIQSFIIFMLFCPFVDSIWGKLYPILSTPTGYSIDHVYELILAKDNNIKTDESTHESIRRIIQQIEGDPAIEAVTVYYGSKHFSSTTSLSIKIDSLHKWSPSFFGIDEHYFDVFKVEIEEDGGIFPWKADNPKIIPTQWLLKSFFENKDAIGKYIYAEGNQPYRISGSIKGKKHLTESVSSRDDICYITLPDNYKYDLQTSIAFKIKDGISYEQFENKKMDDFLKLLEAGAIYPKSLLSFKQIKNDMIYNRGFIGLFSVFAVLLFFIFNIFISTFASFHFRINKRKEEIGLKLSIGASKQRLMKELILEGVVILTLASIPAIIILINLYYLEIGIKNIHSINLFIFSSYILVTYIILLGIVVLGTWLPARRVMKIEPAIALKEE